MHFFLRRVLHNTQIKACVSLNIKEILLMLFYNISFSEIHHILEI